VGFAQDIKKWSDQALAGIARTQRAACLEMAKAVINDTPVKTGRAKANWQAGLNKAPSGVIEQNDPSGEATLAKIQKVLAQMKQGDRFILVNNLPYAQELEDGSSRQAPNGMLKQNLARWQSLLSKAAQGGNS